MFRLFRQDKKAATAVEFSLVAVPFLWMLIGMVELALYFSSASLLAEAANTGARMVRTGQFEEVADPAAAFSTAVCDRAALFIPCEDIQFQVTHVEDDDFRSAVEYAPTYDEDGNLENQGYNAGTASSVVIVRLAYRYQFMTPIIGSMLSTGPSNTTQIVNTIVMKNEPYDA